MQHLKRQTLSAACMQPDHSDFWCFGGLQKGYSGARERANKRGQNLVFENIDKSSREVALALPSTPLPSVASPSTAERCWS